MQKSHIDPATLLIAAPGALLLLLLPASYVWLASIGGLAIFVTLFAFDSEGYRSTTQSLAFALVAALAITVIALVPLGFMAGGNVSLLPLIWAGAALVIWIVDTIRMSSRQNAAYQNAAPGTSAPQRNASVYTPQEMPLPATRRASDPVLVRQESAPSVSRQQPVVAEPVRRPIETMTSPPAEPEPVRTASAAAQVAPEPVRQEPASVTRPIVPAPTEPVISRDPVPTQVPIQPAPPPLESPSVPSAPARSIGPVAPSRPGKETLIYVNLIGEGLNVLRSVQAEHLGKDFYRILEGMPEGETWEFTPGQVVKCKKKNLSSGKALVAVEEAPRAR